LHTDSWEVEPLNWTPAMREEFRKRRGYDMTPWAPLLAGRIVESRSASNRFLHDFRKTLGDLAIDNHYRPFRDGAHRHGLLIHPESGGPHAVPIDAQRCLGFNDAPMSEFWAWSWRHRIGDSNRFFVKQPASAAHTYGRKLVLAEGFTTIGPHWQETLWDNLKPSFDKACCEGLNLLVWHAFVCSPDEQGLPGLQYFAGTHLNPNVTWWTKSAPFFAYINRCQAMLQRGLFVADACYYYGDHVPNFAQHKRTDPARVQPGFDYDVITEDVLLTRASVKDGRIVLPDGMSYRVLVLRDSGASFQLANSAVADTSQAGSLRHTSAISLPVLRKVKELVEAGATVVGPKPTEAVSLRDSDAEVKRLADELWPRAEVPAEARTPNAPGFGVPALAGERPFGKGRVISGKTAREVLLAAGVKPDFECAGTDLEVRSTGVARDVERTSKSVHPSLDHMDYIHRRDDNADIYFVANRTNRAERVTCTFRVAGKAPELWNPVSGERRFVAAYTEADGRISLPLEFAPCGSWFVVFREPAAAHPATAKSNAPQFRVVQELPAPWTAHFVPGMSTPERDAREMNRSDTRQIVFDKLTSWTEHPNPGIKFYSGTASYMKTFALDQSKIQSRVRDTCEANPKSKIFLDLGDLRELAEVRLNGRSLGILWTPPFRVEITDALKPTGNVLQIEVCNFWPNRIIGDDSLPPEKRFTKTNVRKLTKETPLMPSGLFGPVTLQVAQ
ncbi:MAG: glycosyl hydrolase, partial [Verrucomicrobia bacterium]|nr:glycosyl hydrolase [Verrucomicrobiota bacterium]